MSINKQIRQLKLSLAKRAHDISVKAGTEIKLAEVSTDKGVLYYSDDDTLSVGTEVFVMGEDGSWNLPENGEYVAGSITYVVEDGIIVSETDSTQAEAEAGDVPPDENGETVTVDKFNEVLDVLRDVVDTVSELDDKVEEMTMSLSRISKLSNRDFAENKPAISEEKRESQIDKFLGKK